MRKATKHSALFADEEYTWVLTPESLQHGTGIYYIAAVLNKSKASAQQAPTLFSIITAVTQCYFWDSHNSTWKSHGCRVGSCATFLLSSTLPGIKHGVLAHFPSQWSEGKSIRLGKRKRICA